MEPDGQPFCRARDYLGICDLAWGLGVIFVGSWFGHMVPFIGAVAVGLSYP